MLVRRKPHDRAGDLRGRGRIVDRSRHSRLLYLALSANLRLFHEEQGACTARSSGAGRDDIFCVPGRGFEYGRDAVKSHFIENCYRLPGRGIVGDAPWGVVDGWRRKKPEFWLLKKLHSPVRAKENVLAAAPRRASRFACRSRTSTTFSNLSELKIRWSLGDRAGEIQGGRSAAIDRHACRFPAAVPSETAIFSPWSSRIRTAWWSMRIAFPWAANRRISRRGKNANLRRSIS